MSLITWARREELARLRALVEPAAGVRVLDVGGGVGAVADVIARGAGEVVVLEPNAGRVREGRSRFPGLRFENGQGEKIPFPDLRFERVLAIRSFHHLERAEDFLAETLRVLVPGGRLVIEEISPRSLMARFFQLMHHGHLEFRDQPGLRKFLEDAGFREVTVEPYRRWYFAVARK